MNDKLKNLSIEPDEQVWDSVKKTLRRRRMFRRSACAAVAVSAVVVCGLVFLPNDNVQNPIPGQTAVGSDPVVVENVQYGEMDNPVVMNVQASVVSEKEAAPIREQSRASVHREGGVLIEKVPSNKVSLTYDNPIPVGCVANKVESLSELDRVVDALGDEYEHEDPILTDVKTSAPKSHTDEDEPLLWIPNTFAPQGGVEENRTFRVVASQIVENYRIRIFSRNGQEVYESQDITAAWDGTRNGMLLPQAAYVYVVRYSDNDGRQHEQRGTVTLIR